ncbi:MAG: hypothetical protein FWH04_04405 [Oscillospiraceae bacterium]|nr:hypothetical protein [Oscillospiraceae bacterium]
MQKAEIFFSEDSELIEGDVILKGWRGDVFVRISDRIYKLEVITPGRLQDDFEYEMENEGHYLVEPNIVLVRETSKKEIINTINHLCEECYFNKIKELEAKNINSIPYAGGGMWELVQVQ